MIHKIAKTERSEKDKIREAKIDFDIAFNKQFGFKSEAPDDMRRLWDILRGATFDFYMKGINYSETANREKLDIAIEALEKTLNHYHNIGWGYSDTLLSTWTESLKKLKEGE
jgi:RNAse (barnase) inhibitor barstar